MSSLSSCNLSNLTIGAAATNHGGAMEAETISKHGNSPKSLTSRGNSLLRKARITLAVLILAGAVHAQDVIVKTNGDEIQAKVEEIGTAEVRYKRFGSESGPTYVIPKSEVFMIKYADGARDVFEQQAVPAPVAPALTNLATTANLDESTSDKTDKLEDRLTGRLGVGYSSGRLVGEPLEKMSWTGTETWTGSWHGSLLITYNFIPYIGWDVFDLRIVVGKCLVAQLYTGLRVYTPTLGNTHIKGYASLKGGFGLGESQFITYKQREFSGTSTVDFTKNKEYSIWGFTYDYEIGMYLFKNLSIGYVYTVLNGSDGAKEDKRNFQFIFSELRIAWCF